jgi:hypothetical protein
MELSISDNSVNDTVEGDLNIAHVIIKKESINAEKYG